MPRSCSICSHPQASQISKQISALGTLRAISERFSVSTMAVHRHKIGCLRQQPVRKPVPTPAPPTDCSNLSRNDLAADPKLLIRRAELLLDDAQSIVTQAKRDGDARLGLQAIRETRSSLELLMRAYGLLAPDNSVTINASSLQFANVSALSVAELRALANLGSPNQPKAIAPGEIIEGEATEAASGAQGDA